MSTPGFKFAELSWLWPGTGLTAADSIVAVDRRFLRLFDPSSLIWTPGPAPDKQAAFAVNLYKLASFVEAICLNDRTVICTEFPRSGFDGFFPELAVYTETSLIQSSAAGLLRGLATSPLLRALLESGACCFDLDIHITNIETGSRRHFSLDQDFAEVGMVGSALLGSYNGRISLDGQYEWPYSASVESRYKGLKSHSRTIAIHRILEKDKTDEAWLKSRLQLILGTLIEYESRRGISVIPDVLYSDEFYQTIGQETSKQNGRLLLEAYQKIAARSEAERLRARELGQWMLRSNVTLPPCFLMLLDRVDSPKDLPEAILELRSEFAPLRGLRRNLAELANEGSTEEFLRVRATLEELIETDIIKRSEKFGIQRILPLVPEFLLPEEWSFKVLEERAPKASALASVLERLTKVGTEAIEKVALSRRLRPLYTLSDVLCRQGPLLKQIERIWKVRLDERAVQMLELFRHVPAWIGETPRSHPEKDEQMPRTDSMWHQVFISYGGCDEEFASRLNDALVSHGVRTWFFAKDSPPGARLHRVMWQGVNKCDRVLLICSRGGLQRPGVLTELERVLEREARDGGTEILIPVRIDDFIFADWRPEREDLAAQVKDRVVADFRGALDDGVCFTNAVNRLLPVLRRARGHS